LNPYGYVFNNPLQYTDPTGEAVPAIALWMVGGALSLLDMLSPPQPHPEYPDAIESIWTVPGPVGGAKRACGTAEGAIKGIKTPYGIANQGSDAVSLAARSRVNEGATLYRIGTTGKSQAAEAQFWSLEHPLRPGYAQRYGIPERNIQNANFIEAAKLKTGMPFVTRPAPGIGKNVGGGIEVVMPEGGAQLRWFSYGSP